jgi:hypothetical protein
MLTSTLHLGIFYMPYSYDMGPTALLPLRRKACWGFFCPKNPTASAGCEPANLSTKGQHATSRPPKSLTSLLTYLITPWSRVLLEKLTSFQLVKKFPIFYGTRKFITAFTNARHLSLSWASSIQSITSHPTSWRSILILSSHLSLGLPNCLLSSDLHTKTLYLPLLSYARAICPAYHILDVITRIIFGEVWGS